MECPPAEASSLPPVCPFGLPGIPTLRPIVKMGKPQLGFRAAAWVPADRLCRSLGVAETLSLAPGECNSAWFVPLCTTRSAGLGRLQRWRRRRPASSAASPSAAARGPLVGAVIAGDAAPASALGGADRRRRRLRGRDGRRRRRRRVALPGPRAVKAAGLDHAPVHAARDDLHARPVDGRLDEMVDRLEGHRLRRAELVLVDRSARAAGDDVLEPSPSPRS